MYAYIHIHVLIFIYVHKFLPVVPTVAPLQTKDSWIQRERDYKRRDREWGDGASARVSEWKRQSACARERERGRERHRAKVRGRARERERNRKGERGRMRECERERARGELGRRRRNGGEQQRRQSGRGYNWIVRGSNRQEIWGNVTRMNLSVKTHWMTLFSKISLLYRVTPMHESCHTCGGVMSHTWSSLSDFVKHCNTLQHTATHCNTLQHIATHYNTHDQLCQDLWMIVFGFKLSHELITATNESRLTCGGVTSHRWACFEPCHMHEQVGEELLMIFWIQIESHHTHERITSHMWKSHVTQTSMLQGLSHAWLWLWRLSRWLLRIFWALLADI